MTVREILIAYLEENGYDGLYHPRIECGCGIPDLQCCGGWCMGCVPAYRWSNGIYYPDPEKDQKGE